MAVFKKHTDELLEIVASRCCQLVSCYCRRREKGSRARYSFFLVVAAQRGNRRLKFTRTLSQSPRCSSVWICWSRGERYYSIVRLSVTLDIHRLASVYTLIFLFFRWTLRTRPLLFLLRRTHTLLWSDCALISGH